MGCYWRTRLNGATCYERMKILEVEKHAQLHHLQAVAGYLCSLAPLGLADCSNLTATCRVSRWCRSKRSILLICQCTSRHPATKQTYKWRCNNLRPQRS
jgi:hypothetical protein